MQSFVPQDAFILKIQRELCHPIYARRVSGLSRNRPQARGQLKVVTLGFDGNKVRKKVIAQHKLQVDEARLIFYFLN